MIASEPRPLIGEAPLQLDALTQTSIYRVRVNIGTCPQNVRVESWDDFGAMDSYTVAPVDIR
ncbi:MAG: hypothetical protein IIB77_09170 [Proteobacteria bacterium]|nr:hypothetical protein [Pseudomonadota bacterium]